MKKGVGKRIPYSEKPVTRNQWNFNWAASIIHWIVAEQNLF